MHFNSFDKQLNCLTLNALQLSLSFIFLLAACSSVQPKETIHLRDGTMHKVRDIIKGGEMQISWCGENEYQRLFTRIKGNKKK
jgi:hypothetical protein